jgi:glyoxylase-like metal-dependent hydrolase (beta-lactamase superfamily II)
VFRSTRSGENRDDYFAEAFVSRAWCKLLVLLLFMPAIAHAQVSVADTYLRARRVLDAAVAAHGGRAALGEAGQMRITLAGQDVWRNQSRRPAPPYDTEPLRIELRVDLARNRVVRDQFSAYPGGIRRDSRSIVDSAGNYFVNFRTRSFAPWPPNPQPANRDFNLMFFPQMLVLTALENAHTLRSLGEIRLSSGAIVEAITMTAWNQGWTIYFDKETKLARGFANVFRDALTGDAAVEHEYVDYKVLNGVLLPGKRISRVAGEVTRELNYVSADPKYTMPDSLVRVPGGFTPDPTGPNEPVRQLASGVWLVNNVLAVALSDHVVVIDAPGNAANTIQRIGTLAPGKPIRFVVPTHHHDDHSGGLKDYAAHGAAIVTTAANRDYMIRMATSRGTIGADPPPLSRPPVVEIMTDRRVFSDGTRTVEVHNVKGNPHSDDMLVAWIPSEGILYQGDLIEGYANGGIMPGTNNETTAHFGEWLERKGWRVRSFVGTHGSLSDPALFDQILRQPYYRPEARP